jgi:hypothetical protein
MNRDIAQHRLAPAFEARYRAQSAKPAPVLIRKRCACGATVIAKQLAQYGMCAKCVKAAA